MWLAVQLTDWPDMQGWAFPGVAAYQQQQQQHQQPHEQQQQQHPQAQPIVRKPSSGDQLVQVCITCWHGLKSNRLSDGVQLLCSQ